MDHHNTAGQMYMDNNVGAFSRSDPNPLGCKKKCSEMFCDSIEGCLIQSPLLYPLDPPFGEPKIEVG